MTARCTICNNFLFFDDKEIKKQPGFRPKCDCGSSSVEVMTSSGPLKGEHPYFPNQGFTDPSGQLYFYAYRNSQGEYYVYHSDKMIKVDNPIPFNK